MVSAWFDWIGLGESCIFFTVITAGFWRSTKLDQLAVFELLEPAFDGSLRYRKSAGHFNHSLARVFLDMGKKSAYSATYSRAESGKTWLPKLTVRSGQNCFHLSG